MFIQQDVLILFTKVWFYGKMTRKYLLTFYYSFLLASLQQTNKLHYPK